MSEVSVVDVFENCCGSVWIFCIEIMINSQNAECLHRQQLFKSN